ncbi:hypothetical protein MKEN_00049500 [Mycena kentingensis (nom. inval.)]|nr:hypothetical protein MKEN_00049500 [Mycena kentingensis (nom. inval.)]
MVHLEVCLLLALSIASVSARIADFAISARGTDVARPPIAGFRMGRPFAPAPAAALVLAGRQEDGGVPQVPTQCEPTCNPINDILSTGTCQPSLCCTELFQAGYFQCLLCVGQAENATKAEFAQAQNLLDTLTVSCSKLGFPLPELTLPGQNSSRIIPTASGKISASSVSQVTIESLPSTNAPASTTRMLQTTISAPATQTGETSANPSPSLPGGAASVRVGVGVVLGMLVGVVGAMM